jgi:hypothetical protein
MGTVWEVRIGSLLAAAGLIWTARIASSDLTGLDALSFTNLPRGPLEVCAIGILVWMHAKWRQSVHVH